MINTANALTVLAPCLVPVFVTLPLAGGAILFRELAVTGLRFWVIARGVIAASRGKAQTPPQVIAIALYILPGPFQLARVLVMGAAVVVTLLTGAEYAARAVRLRRGRPRRAGGVRSGAS